MRGQANIVIKKGERGRVNFKKALDKRKKCDIIFG